MSGGGGRGSSLDAIFDPLSAGPSDPSLPGDGDFALLLDASFRARIGHDLVPPAVRDDAARWLYAEAPFCLLVHNAAADPRFVYANRVAQDCFEFDWDAFTRLPSRLSARPGDRAGRQAFIDRVRRDGFATGYAGPRVARSGRRFVIEDVTMWQVADAAGTVWGEAAVYARWRPRS